MRTRKSTTKTFIDPKEQLVNGETLERNNKQLRERSIKTTEKRPTPSDDDEDVGVLVDDSGKRHETPQGNKRTRTRGDMDFSNDKSRIIENQLVQDQVPTTNSNPEDRAERVNITNHALAYAIERNLQAIKLECSPPLENREHSKKFVINFFKCLNKDFRHDYPKNTQPLGFHKWWTDTAGKCLYGITNDVDLFIYLCDPKHYPAQIDNVKIRPDPPKRLPPQNTIVIKFMPNEIHTNEIKDELTNIYPSIFSVEDMLGTMRSKCRHIRVEFCQRSDYAKLMDDGKVGLQGQIFEVEEYLPPPKILICNKCHIPGHTKKACQSSINICRRCGMDRNNGNNHAECPLKCYHCSGTHQATDYKCPIIIKFRQDLLIRLKNDRNKLPPNVKLFIPVDCRVNGDRNRFITSDNQSNHQTSGMPRTTPINPWTANQYESREPKGSNGVETSIKTMANELEEIKKVFDLERERMKEQHESNMKIMKQGWSIMQQQIQAQNQCINIMASMLKENATMMNQVISQINMLSGIVKINCPGETERNQIDISQMMTNSTANHFKNLNDTYTRQEDDLRNIMNKQTTMFETTMELLSSSKHE